MDSKKKAVFLTGRHHAGICAYTLYIAINHCPKAQGERKSFIEQLAVPNLTMTARAGRLSWLSGEQIGL